MTESTAKLHEDPATLEAGTVERHRAFVSLVEELEAADWYDQRVDSTSDSALAAILAHNRDDEKAHAAMAHEWLCGDDPALDAHLPKFLFTEGDIPESGNADSDGDVSSAEGAGAASDTSLGIGSLREPS